MTLRLQGWTPERGRAAWRAQLTAWSCALVSSLMWSATVAAQCLSAGTPFPADNSNEGIMFDVVATDPVRIRGIDSELLQGSPGDYEIYYRAGTFVGFGSSATGWTLAGSAAAVLPRGPGQATPIPIPLSVSIPAGQRYAFYLTRTSPTGGLRYRNFGPVGTALNTGQALTVYAGTGKTYPFSTDFPQRSLVGAIQFDSPVAGNTSLSITKTDGANSEIPGTPVTYTIVAANGGPNTGGCATVADTFAPTLSACAWTCVGANGGSCPASGSGHINALVGLPNTGTATFTASCNIDSAATGTLTNTATVTAAPLDTDSNPANNTATDINTLVLPVNADLAITKSDSVSAETPGSVVTWRIVASNAGPTAATGATVSDSFPAGLSACTWMCIAGSGASCPASGSGNLSATVDLPVAGSVTFHATCLIDAGASGTLANTASVAVPIGGTDPNPANNSADDSDTLDAVLTERTPANWSLISSGTPSARINHGMAHDPVSGLTLLFGGAGGGFLNDLYQYQPSTGWALVDPGVTRPGGRRSFGFAAGNGSFYLHAGVDANGETSDFWRYTPGSGWTQLDPGAAAGPTHPGPRLGASSLFDPVRNRFVFFGGRRSGVATNETWAFQFPGNTWVQLDAGGASAAVPAVRENHNLVYDPTLDAYLLFGGNRGGGTGDPHYNDVWLYTPGSGWSLRDPGGVAGPDRPTRRVTSAMAYDPLRQRYIMHGGSDILGSPQVWHNNTWEYDAAANRWRELQILTPMPTLAASAGIAFDTTINRIVIANGRNESNLTQSDTYELGIVVPIELSIADVAVVEGNSGTTTLNFTVALDAPANAGGVGFDIATQDAVATAPSDYVARTLTGQSIAQGQSSATFAVTINGDTAVESDEILRVLVSNVTGATLIDGEAIGTIRTDEFRTLAVNDTGKITCVDNTTTATGTVSPATPDPEAAGFNEQDCTRGASAADALGVLYKQGGSSQPGRDYSKIANDGSELPNSATLGSAAGDWACTRDNATGLVWEVKTDDGGLRDKDHRYTWYDPDPNRNGGNAGSTGSDSCASTLPGGLCNMQAYRTAVNALAGGARLCGATDWRLPDLTELHTLIHYGVPISDPSIDTAWFPNSISSTGGTHFNGFYWSRETNAKFLHAGWGVYFSPLAVGGYVEAFDKIALRHVRLVRGGQ